MQTVFAVRIGDSLQQGFNNFFAFIPKLLGFLVILLVGYIVARIVRTVITKALDSVGLDRALHSGSTGSYVNKVAPNLKPSSTIGAIAFWFLLLGTISIAVSALGIPALTTFVQSIGDYLPNIIAAIVIFVVAGVIAAAVGGLVTRTMGDTPTGKVVGSVVPVLIMAIATFMILNQLKIAPQIVTITYAALIGGVALAMALAFGLGGREAASTLLQGAVAAGAAQSGQVKQDMQVGKERAQQDAQRVQAEASSRVGDGQPGPAVQPGARRPGR